MVRSAAALVSSLAVLPGTSGVSAVRLHRTPPVASRLVDAMGGSAAAVGSSYALLPGTRGVAAVRLRRTVPVAGSTTEPVNSPSPRPDVNGWSAAPSPAAAAAGAVPASGTRT